MEELTRHKVSQISLQNKIPIAPQYLIYIVLDCTLDIVRHFGAQFLNRIPRGILVLVVGLRGGRVAG